MKYLLVILFSFLLFSANAQKREFLDENSKIITDSTLAKYVRISQPDGKKHLLQRTYLVKGHLIEEASLTQKNGVRDGIWKAMFEKTGSIKYEASYTKGKQNGIFRTYFENGRLRREEHYKDNLLISGKCFTQAGSDTIHYPFATPPSFPGGDEEFRSYLQEHLKTMINNRQRAANNTFGRTMVTFFISKDGLILDSEIVKSANKEFDKPILRIINSMPNWEPGREEGVPTKSRMTLPIMFY